MNWDKLPRQLYEDAMERLKNHGLTVWDTDALFVEYLPVLSDEAIDWLGTLPVGVQLGETMAALRASSTWWQEHGHDAVLTERLHEVAHDERLA